MQRVTRTTLRWRLGIAVCAILTGALPAVAQTTTRAPASQWHVARMPDGRPDLQGTWTNNTATPLERPADLAGKTHLTEEEAAEFERTWLSRLVEPFPEADRLGADLSEVWFDPAKVVPDRRTSLIVEPETGVLPPLVPAARDRTAARAPGNYDDPESRPLGERCLVGADIGGLSIGPPIVPNPLAFNYYQIVQAPTHLLIFSELVHDVRVVRIGGEHLPQNIRRWFGDSIGHWEGDTLVVDTTNVSEKVQYRGSTGRIHVVERLRRTGPSTITYRATVDDPDTWSTPWTMEIPFAATSARLFEYACHEHNYSMAGALRGARADEKAGKK
jgi:hypothetical protein